MKIWYQVCLPSSPCFYFSFWWEKFGKANFAFYVNLCLQLVLLLKSCLFCSFLFCWFSYYVNFMFETCITSDELFVISFDDLCLQLVLLLPISRLFCSFLFIFIYVWNLYFFWWVVLISFGDLCLLIFICKLEYYYFWWVVCFPLFFISAPASYSWLNRALN